MCGIIGYIGRQEATPILLDGLKRLEYRGYDSSGIAVAEQNRLTVIKRTGRVESLFRAVTATELHGRCGISHTRWATHGRVSDENAHPHISSDGKIALVHNGVIENFEQIKKFLLEQGYAFQSDTDTEVLCNLIAYHYNKQSAGEGGDRFEQAVRKSLLHVEGTYGIAVICTEAPGKLLGARKGSPIVLGVGQEEFFLASDVSAFAGRARNVAYLDDGQVVVITPSAFRIATVLDEMIAPVLSKLDGPVEAPDIGDYDHFMQKEIFEQPRSLENAMRGRFSGDGSTAQFGGLNMEPREIRQIDRIVLIGCGTARHACLVAEYLIERYARIPVEVEYASEFRYRNAPLDKNTLVFVMSQSGETIDTLEALRESKRKGYRTLAITNVVGSSIARESDGGIYQHAGQEIGVASTKAFTSQVLISAMLALYLGRLRDLSFSYGTEMVRALRAVPELAKRVLEQADAAARVRDRRCPQLRC